MLSTNLRGPRIQNTYQKTRNLKYEAKENEPSGGRVLCWA